MLRPTLDIARHAACIQGACTLKIRLIHYGGMQDIRLVGSRIFGLSNPVLKLINPARNIQSLTRRSAWLVTKSFARRRHQSCRFSESELCSVQLEPTNSIQERKLEYRWSFKIVGLRTLYFAPRIIIFYLYDCFHSCWDRVATPRSTTNGQTSRLTTDDQHPLIRCKFEHQDLVVSRINAPLLSLSLFSLYISRSVRGVVGRGCTLQRGGSHHSDSHHSDSHYQFGRRVRYARPPGEL